MAFLEEYTLLDELGQGGYATVYKVRHNNLGYIRAIRVLNAIIAHGETDMAYQKFIEECRLLLRLGNGNHPNIVHIYQPLLKAQRAIVEMDFVDGKNLYHYIEENSSFVEIGDVMKFLTDIGSALSYCHYDIYRFCMDKEEDGLLDDPDDGSKVLLDENTRNRLVSKYKVIHNDIHSGNIIRREDGTYVLLDFGLAIDGDSVVRSSRRKNGAPEFKSPEKWDNDSILSTESDIYSFGVVLYEFLAGRVPFMFDKKNSNAVEAEYLLGKAHKEQVPESVFKFRKQSFERLHPGEIYEKDYPDWLEALIMKCLAKNTKDRFSDGKELFDYIKEHVSDNVSTEELSVLEKENSDLRLCMIVKNVELSALKKEQSALIAQLEQMRSAESISKDALSTRLEELGEQYTQKIKTVNEISDSLKGDNERLKVEARRLKMENKRLRNRKPGVSNPIWKILVLLFLPMTLILGTLYTFDYLGIPLIPHIESPEICDSPANIPDEINNNTLVHKDKQIQEQKAEIAVLNKQIVELNIQIKEKDNRIASLSEQIEKLNYVVKELVGN